MSPLAPSATIQLLGTTEFGNLLDCCHSVCHSPTSGNAESETVSVNHSSASANFGQSCGIASHSITYLTFSTNLAWLGKSKYVAQRALSSRVPGRLPYLPVGELLATQASESLLV